MALSHELTKRLHNYEEPPCKRLRLAEAAFRSADFPVVRKEEMVLDWICNDENLDKNSYEFWNTLLSCIKCERLKELHVNDIKSSVKSSLIQMLTGTITNGDVSVDVQRIVLECVLATLDNVQFQNSFRMSLAEYMHVITAALKIINDEKHVLSIIDNICLMHEKSFEKQDFSVMFIRHAYFPLIEASLLIEDTVKDATTSTNLHAKLLKCQSILFPKGRLNDRLKFLKSWFITSVELIVDPSINEIVSLLLQLSSGSVVSSVSIINTTYLLTVKAFINAHRKQNVGIYQFVVLCGFLLGFTPKVRRSSGDICLFSMTNLKKMYHGSLQVIPCNELSFKIMSSILSELHSHSISLDGVVRDVSFVQWLHALFHSVFPKKKQWKPTAECLDLLHKIIILCPLAAETSQLYSVLWHIMLARKNTPEIKKNYDVFMISLCDVFIKVSLLPKFIDSMINMLKEKISVLKFNTSVEEIVSDEWGTHLCTNISALSSSQCISSIDALITCLSEDCAEVLEKRKPDASLELLMQILSKVLSLFLKGAKMATYTVPYSIKMTFWDSLVRLRTVLHSIGEALLNQEHNAQAMNAYLEICYHWGECTIIMLHYVYGSKPETLLQDDKSACNLSALHKYLSNDQWNSIAERILNFGSASCHSNMNKLVVQKLQMFLLFNDDPSLEIDIGNQIAYHLIRHCSSSEIYDIINKNPKILTSFLDENHILFVAEQIVKEVLVNRTHFEQKIALLKDNETLEDRSLSMALISVTLNKIAELFMPKHSSDDNSVFLRPLLGLNIVEISNNENSKLKLSNLSKQLGEALNKCCKEERSLNGCLDRADEELLVYYLKLLAALPVPHMVEDVTRLVVLSIFCIGCHAKGTKLGNTVFNTLYGEVLFNIAGKVPKLNLVGYVHFGYLCIYLLKQTQSLEPAVERLLFKYLFNNYLTTDGCVDDFEPFIRFLSQNTHNFNSYANVVCPLLVTYSKKKKQDASKVVANYQVLIKPIRKMLLSSLKSGSVTLCCVMEVYCLLLTYHIWRKKKVNLLLAHLDEFVTYALEGVKTSANPPQIRIYLGLLSVVLKYRNKLPKFWPQDFVTKVCHSVMHLNDLSDILKALYGSITKQEFENLSDDLLTQTKTQTLPLAQALSFWKIIIGADLSAELFCIRQKKAIDLCHYLLEINIPRMSEEFFQLLLLMADMAKCSQITMEPHMIDLCFSSMWNLHGCDTEFLKYWLAMRDILYNLITYRAGLILDRLPSFLYSVGILFTSLTHHSAKKQNLAPEKMETLVKCAASLELLFSAIIRYKTEFSRPSLYLLASVLSDLEKNKLGTEITRQLTHCVNCLITMCDPYSASYLLRTLPPSTSELFDRLYKQYKKFVKFRGRV